MIERTGAHVLVESLIAEEVDTLFGIPGVATLGVYDAFLDHPEIRAINVRHEQSAVFMADGYARSSGRIGVAVTSGGPGALNTLTAMSTAFTDSSPVLHIMNENPAAVRRKGRGYFHDISDQFGIFRPVSDFGAQPVLADEIAPAVHQAMFALRNRRPRPAVVEVAAEAFEQTTNVMVSAAAPTIPSQPDAAAIQDAVTALAQARRPVLWAGGGVVAADAQAELTAIAELLGAPVLTTQAGKGGMRADHPLHVGNWGNEQPVRDLLERSDVVLAVGTRFSYFPTGAWSLDPGRRIIQIDMDPAEIGRNYRVELGIVGDAKLSLDRLHAGLATAVREGDAEPRARREAEVAEVHAAIRAAVGSHPELDVLEQMRRALPEDARVFNDPTTIAFWARSAWRAFLPRTWFVPSGFGTLGFALPAVIGAKVATPEHPCVAVIGDAGAMFTIQDLMTAVQERIPAIIMVFNDQGYGVERRHQDHLYGRRSGVDVDAPDFVAVAKAFGARGLRVDDLSAVGSTVESVLDTDGPVVIEIPNQFSHPGYGAWATYN